MVKKIIHRYWLFILLAFLATLIGGIVLLKKPPALNLPQISGLVFKKAKIIAQPITYQFKLEILPQSPKQLPVFHSFKPTAFDYSKLIIINLEGEKIIDDPDRAIIIAKEFLTQNNRRVKELANSEFQTGFLKVGGYEVFKTNSLATADIISVHLYPKIDNYLIVGSSPFAGLIEIWVAKNGQVQKVKDMLADFDLSSPINYPLITFTQAQQAIGQQKGTVVVIQSQEETYLPQEIKINSIMINKAYLAYFQEEFLPAYIQPIWIFEGETTFQNGQNSAVAVYLPAIKENYFTPEPSPAL